MRHSPLIGTALALALAASLPIPAAAAVWREQSDATLDARSATAIDVRNARGLIDVRPSADGAIHVRALKIAHGRTTADARRLADQTIVKFDPGAIVKLEVVYPRIVHQVNLWRSFNDDDLPKSEIRFSIEVPARLAATLTVSSGEIHTEELNGAQTLRSSSGDIEVLQAGGPVNARSASGDIDVDRARGGEAPPAAHLDAPAGERRRRGAGPQGVQCSPGGGGGGGDTCGPGGRPDRDPQLRERDHRASHHGGCHPAGPLRTFVGNATQRWSRRLSFER